MRLNIKHIEPLLTEITLDRNGDYLSEGKYTGCIICEDGGIRSILFSAKGTFSANSIDFKFSVKLRHEVVEAINPWLLMRGLEKIQWDSKEERDFNVPLIVDSIKAWVTLARLRR
jgi:hypothetical protein